MSRQLPFLTTLLAAFFFGQACLSAPNTQNQSDEQPRDEQVEQAKKHFENGIRLLKIQDWYAAASEFEASIALYPTKSALYNLANIYQAQHRYVVALQTFEQLLADYKGQLTPQMELDAKKRIEATKPLIAIVTLHIQPRTATVSQKGIPLPAAPENQPLEVLLSPGAHTFEIAADRYVTTTIEISVLSGEKRIERIALTPIVTPTSPLSEDPKASRNPKALFVPALVTTIAAVGAIGTAGAMWIYSSSHYRDWEAAEAIGNTQQMEIHRQKVENMQTPATIVSIGAGVLAITATALWIAHKKRQNRYEKTEISPAEVSFTPQSLIIQF